MRELKPWWWGIELSKSAHTKADSDNSSTLTLATTLPTLSHGSQVPCTSNPPATALINAQIRSPYPNQKQSTSRIHLRIHILRKTKIMKQFRRVSVLPITAHTQKRWYTHNINYLRYLYI
jgi:hypothetical protein